MLPVSLGPRAQQGSVRGVHRGLIELNSLGARALSEVWRGASQLLPGRAFVVRGGRIARPRELRHSAGSGTVGGRYPILYLSPLGGPRCKGPCQGGSHTSSNTTLAISGEGPKAHIRKLAECIRWSYGAGIVLRLGNIARLELNYCIPMGVQRGDRCVEPLSAP